MKHSLWLDEYKLNTFPSLTNDLEVDVLVVGGGITGISSAYLLAEEGFKVAIVEASKLMHGTTGHTTAKVTIQHGLVYQNLIKKHGLEKAQLYVNSHLKALDLMKENIRDLDIKCDFETTTSYVYTEKNYLLGKIEKELEAAKKLNIDSFVTESINLPFKIESAIGFKNQAHFDVSKYLQPIVEDFSDHDDCYVFENSKVVKIKEDNNFCHTYLENGVKVKSRHVVLASHYPCNDPYNFYFAKLKPSMTYIVAGYYNSEFTDGDYINVEKPTRSFRTQIYNDKRLLLVAGENHQSGHTELDSKHYQNLTDFGKKYFNMDEPLYQWSTQDYNTFDKLPYIGSINKNSPHVIVATGYKKWGMLTSHVAAMLARDLITNKKTEYEDLYSPCRITDKLSCQFFSYNLKSLGRLVGDRLKPMPKEFDVEVGCGKIVSYKGKKYGVYKDEDGKSYIVDVVCPHLKCILTFNNEHKTYDCPCHGSRFTYKGKYLDGPSIKDLKRINFNELE